MSVLVIVFIIRETTTYQVLVVLLLLINIINLLNNRRIAGKQKKSATLFGSIVNEVSQGVYITDEDNRFVYINPGMCEVAGYKEAELLGKKTLDFVTLKDQSSVLQKREERKSGYTTSLEADAVRADGSTIPVLISAKPIIEDGIYKGNVGVITEITSLKMTETELRAQQELLEEKITDRTRELKDAKAKAEAANQLKTEFLANMSHELRTPLHHILSFSKFGQKKMADGPNLASKEIPEKLLSYFDKIQLSADKMLNLVNDLLDLSRYDIWDNTSHKESNSIRYVYNNVKSDLEPRLLEKGLKLDIQEFDAHALFDFSQIKQVALRLVNNAIRYAESGSTIEIAFIEDSEKITVATVNRGIPIPVEELRDIFNPFIQSSKTKTGAGGIGLGLSISKRIIEDHHGEIWAEENQTGATIKYALPKEL